MITVNFTNNEALILFEFLSTIVDAQDNDNTLDAGTMQAIHNLISEFESELVEPMKPDYEELLELAKQQLLVGKIV